MDTKSPASPQGSNHVGAGSEAGDRQPTRSLQAPEEPFHPLMFERVYTGIAVLDEHGRVERCNPAMLALLQCDADAAVGQDIFSLMPCEDFARARSLFTNLVDDRLGEVLVECHRTGPDGGTRWIYGSLSAVPGIGDRPTRIILFAGDRTERHLAALEVQRREQVMHTLMQTAADAIVMIDGGGTITAANPAAAKLFGYSLEDLQGRNVSVLQPPGEAGNHDRYMARYHATREPHILGNARAVTARRKDGSLFQARLVAAEIEHGKLYVAFMHDLTASNALREDIVSVATLEQRRIGQELHDATQQELTGHSLLAQALADKLRGAGKDAGDLELAEMLARGLALTQRSVQDIARGLLPVPVDAQSLPAALDGLAERTNRIGGMRCVSRCHALPGSFGPETATHLYRIAQEALSNALRHSRAGQVSVQLLVDDHAATLSIEDDGIGMERGTDPGQRRGVGLRLMEHRCSLAGGQLSIGSPAGVGTVVACRIPIARSLGSPT
jgi:PAS domain S-box-containing protein